MIPSPHPRRTGPLSGLLAVASMLSVHCAGDLALPEPPDLAPLEARYDAPTLALDPENAEAVLRAYLEQRERLQQVRDFQPLVDALVQLDEKTTVEPETGAVVIGGVPLRTDAVVSLYVDCPGWSDGAPAVDAFVLTVVVRQSRLIPVVWGPIRDCRLEPGNTDPAVRLRFSGDVAGYVPNILAEADDVPQIIYVQYGIDELVVNEQFEATWSGDFRLVDTRLELLVERGDGHLVVFVGRDPDGFGIRASNGEWRCFTSERRCEASASGQGFSY